MRACVCVRACVRVSCACVVRTHEHTHTHARAAGSGVQHATAQAVEAFLHPRAPARRARRRAAHARGAGHARERRLVLDAQRAACVRVRMCVRSHANQLQLARYGQCQSVCARTRSHTHVHTKDVRTRTLTHAHTRTHARAHAHTRAHTHARTNARTQQGGHINTRAGTCSAQSHPPQHAHGARTPVPPHAPHARAPPAACRRCAAVASCTHCVCARVRARTCVCEQARERASAQRRR